MRGSFIVACEIGRVSLRFQEAERDGLFSSRKAGYGVDKNVSVV